MEEGAAAIAGSGGCQASGLWSQAGLAARRAACRTTWQHDNGHSPMRSHASTLRGTTTLLHLPASS